MRIVMVANATAVHLQRWAAAYRDAGHHVTVVSIRSSDIPGVDVRTVRVGPTNSQSTLWTLLSYVRLALTMRRIVRACDPDVVNPHFVTTNGTLARIAGVHPIVLTAWGSDVIPRDGRRPNPFVRALNRWAIDGADRVTAASDFLAAWVRRTAPRAPVDVVPFGVDTTVFRPVDDGGGGDHVVGVVKSLEHRYGIDAFIRAIPAVVRVVPETRFVIAGGGRLEPSLRALADELGVSDRVTFLGRVPHEDVPSVVAGLSVAVNPTAVPESFGVAVLEASACAVPVVATDVGGVPEVCVDRVTGIMVRPGDPGQMAAAIVELLGDASLRSSMGDAGRRYVVANFEWSVTVDRMLTVLQEAVGAS
jgi:glycosyltransferase involved in cell wall biosynthesis